MHLLHPPTERFARTAATASAFVVVLAATWTVFSIKHESILEAAFVAIPLSVLVIVFGHFLWQPGKELESIRPKAIAGFFLAMLAFIVISFTVDVVIARVNPMDPTQWHNLWKAAGPFGFAMTALSAIILPPLFLATAVRAALLNLLLPRPE